MQQIEGTMTNRESRKHRKAIWELHLYERRRGKPWKVHCSV
jgi:hypothetical protein